ncbi:sigma factor-like helix-turn-helix DNA-binding protein [Nocardia sp. NPDC060249]|uniref:sigma factor-like helix-turn-helix DNA-binding protein n=1 Tax=Nocardia sp. NPDC060249 TaxID=3347082 RepID=UPI00365D4318
MARKNTVPVETLVATQENRKRALELRMKGKSQAEIAEELDVSTSTVSRYISTAVADITRETADEYLQLELSRLDAMLAAIWPDIIGDGEGKTWLIDRALAIMDQRAKLTGTYKTAELKAIAEVKGGVAVEATSMVGNFFSRLEELVAADALAQRDESNPE